MCTLSESVQIPQHGHLYGCSGAQMITRFDQSAHCTCVYAKVFTDVFASTSIQPFTRLSSYGHLDVGSLVGYRIVLLIVFSNRGRFDERHGQKRLESLWCGCFVKDVRSQDYSICAQTVSIR